MSTILGPHGPMVREVINCWSMAVGLPYCSKQLAAAKAPPYSQMKLSGSPRVHDSISEVNVSLCVFV